MYSKPKKIGSIEIKNRFVRSATYEGMASKDDYIPGLSKIAETAHKYGDNCKIALQIAHCGRQTAELENTIAPSAVEEKLIGNMPREMTREEIRETICLLYTSDA